MTKRPSLFSRSDAPASSPAAPTASAAPPAAASTPPLAASSPPVPPTPPAEPANGRKYPVAKTREGKRVATVYLDPLALKQLQRIALDEDTSLQDLLSEGVNAIFETRGLSRIA